MNIKPPFLNIVLHEPEIPNNTGNIGRTCVGSNSRLHLVEPLGFDVSDKQLKRSGLDYWPDLDWLIHANWETCRKKISDPSRVWVLTTKTARPLYQAKFEPGDWMIFGRETRGLPVEILQEYDAKALTIPIYGPIRSYNLANAVAVATFEALRQFAERGLLHSKKQ